ISAGGDVAGHSVDSLAANQPKRVTAAWSVPADQPYSQPYWLRKAHAGDIYEIEDQRSIGMADTPPVLTSEFALRFHDVGITLRRPVRYRYVDPTEGELRRSPVVVPPVAVNRPDPVASSPSSEEKKSTVAC